MKHIYCNYEDSQYNNNANVSIFFTDFMPKKHVTKNYFHERMLSAIFNIALNNMLQERNDQTNIRISIVISMILLYNIDNVINDE